ncbi:MAG: DUF4105 domain-containing protein [Chitinivibrionales bacterium]|nr:DUF4105 domain-containing protein [Chitinivibrionales bacterium]
MSERQDRRPAIRMLMLGVGLLLAGAIVFVLAVLRGPSLATGQMVSVSTAPAGDDDRPPVFSRCDTIECSCACDDPFDPRTRAIGGQFNGMCLNTCRTRTALPLSADSAAQLGYFPDAADSDERYHYVVNVYHLPDTADTPSFWVARIPRDAVTDAIFQVEHAGGVQGHAQMRFRLHAERPAVLVPQRTEAPRATEMANDLYYSVEAIGPPGVPYKGDFGFRREYRQRYRLTTQLIRATTMIRTLQRAVHQFRLDITGEQACAMLTQAIEQGRQADPDERYHTSQNNCALRIYSIVDAVLPPAWYRRPLLWITDNTLFMPTRVGQHLRYRGLAGTPFRLPNLEVELGWEEHVANEER